jgi:hypothetical protein
MGNRNKVIDLREPFEVNHCHGSKTAYTLRGRVVSRYLKRKSTHSTPRSKARGMPFDKLRALNLSKGSGLILHFDELSVLSLSKEAALNPDLEIGV